ncbi:regulatory protein [Proteus mirabilis]|uniref:Regulatory protein n=1 Tax=Proteus mirabilis TaxID=584 RepID=A0A2X2C6P2_PROMI|nr:regulatory protein [Proteus mirabilis]
MTDKMKEMLKFAQEMEDAGVTDGSTTKRIAARIKAKELQAKYKHPTPMTGEDIKGSVSKIISLNLPLL